MHKNKHPIKLCIPITIHIPLHVISCTDMKPKSTVQISVLLLLKDISSSTFKHLKSYQFLLNQHAAQIIPLIYQGLYPISSWLGYDTIRITVIPVLPQTWEQVVIRRGSWWTGWVVNDSNSTFSRWFVCKCLVIKQCSKFVSVLW